MISTVEKEPRVSLNDISAIIIDRYSKRYSELGYHIRTLGWGSIEQQQYRFAQTLSTGVDFTGKRVVDIGCGFGDYLNFLDESSVHYLSYYGVDINPDLVGEAAKRHSSHEKSEFSVTDLHNCSSLSEPVGDIGVMLGLLNLNLSERLDNYRYARMMITNALKLINEVLIVDFISYRRDESYPQEDFIFYYQPSRMLEIAFEFSDNVTLKHDYLPIPQKEFMLIIRK